MTRERRNDSGDSEGSRKNLCTIQPGSISSLRCQKSRISLSIRTSECGTMFSRTNDLSHFNKPIGNQTIWWSQTGSNRRPHACKARALPAELWPRNQKTNAHSMSVVGLGRLELPTSRLSSARSNQLSYKPLTHIPSRTLNPAYAGPARVRPRRKRNEDGEIPPMQLNDPDDRWPLMFLKRSDRQQAV